MKYSTDQIHEESMQQLREYVKNYMTVNCYSPCWDCNKDSQVCRRCEVFISELVLKELCGEDYCKYCDMRSHYNPDGIVTCGHYCDDDDEQNFFTCFEPDYLAILDAITGQQGGD